MSGCDTLLGRRSFLARLGGAVAMAGLVAACGQVETVGESGSLFEGKTRLPPISGTVPAGHVSVQMMPFTGLPVTVGDGIYQNFRSQAKAAGIEVVNRLEEPATWRIVGNFVALGNESSATVIYTYDIFDASGQKVRRSVGQEVVKLTETDPWSGVDTDAQKRLAAHAVRAIRAWLSRAPG